MLTVYAGSQKVYWRLHTNMTITPSPDAMVALGKKAYEDEDYQNAAQQFEQAAQTYQAAGEKVLAAEMWNNCSVAHLKSGNARLALEVVKGSDQIFADAGDLQKQAMSLGNQAAALEGLHRFEEALDLYLQSNQILKEIGDQDFRPYVLQSIAGLQLRTGRQLDALVSSDIALGMKKKLSLQERFLKKLLEITKKLLNR